MTAAPPAATSEPVDESSPRPQAPRRPQGRRRHRAIASIAVALVAVASSAAWALVHNEARSVPQATPVDTALCADLDRLGRSFYTTYYVPLSRTGGYGTGVYIQLAASTAAVATIGAPAGQIDGSMTITSASPGVRAAMTDLVLEANPVAQAAARSSIFGSAAPVPTVGRLLGAFHRATIECRTIDRAPSWFDPTVMPDN